MKTWFKENQNHLIIIGIFLLLVVFYFTPVWQGKTLLQSDVMQARGSQKEIFDYKEKDGNTPLWTNSMFGGMPTYQIWYDHASNITTHIGPAIRAVFPPPSDVLLLFLLGGYFLFSVLKIRPWVAAIGAVALAFSSYNMIYVEAGHINKAYAIAYMAPIIGSVILCYRGSKFWGPSLLALFLALELRANHIQMTYYLFLALLVLVGFELYYAIRDKKLNKFLQATGLQLIGVVIAVLVNASVLFPTYEYSKETIRGKANLTKTTEDGKDAAGLDKEYAYAWSQGIGENITFLIPNAYGGKTGGTFNAESNTVKTLTKLGVPQGEALQYANRAFPTYWGEKTFTSGPWYFGAGVIFLFVLALFVVKDRLKWWILSATLLTLFLAFGRHLPFISDLFFDYFPMYNKFRAVESILVIPSVLIPLLAIMGLNEIISRGNEIKDLDKKVLYTGGALAAICLLIALMPSLLSLRNSTHQDFVTSVQQSMPDPSLASELVNSLLADRSDMASKDAWRSFFIVALTFAFVWFFIKKKLSAGVLIAAIAVITLVDLWSVDKRYLNNESFVDKSIYEKPIPEREVDQLIHLDKDLSYRVFDLTTSPFNDAGASYFHKSIGGYHAAKLMRFQELLENQFNGDINEDVLDMLNVRYIITKDQSNNSDRIQRRSSALGNAWFVNNIKFVNGNQAEMSALSNFDPKKEAIINEGLKGQLGDKTIGQPNNAEIKLVSYHPDTLKYEYSAGNNVFAVFSEIFYDKGWKAYVDGEEYPIIRTDYLLRGLSLPGGNHKVEFIFAPESMKVSKTISLIASIILVLGLGFAIWLSIKHRDERQKPIEGKN
ncbi:YfhO family protein [Sphingobacterium endophyticum]|uniref:YfhO family protein n=1 Tax=Sphingobacterium endophyticum TaxID=2546448 RepID=UPI0012E295F1|nr:YfhO family protein [Sphingobacterium endophyticum]